MNGHDPPHPDIGDPNFSSADENTKFRLLNETWESCRSYPFPTRLIGAKQRKLNGEWLLKKNWLRYSKVKDAVYCVSCILFGGTDGRAKTFVAGTSDWKNLSALISRHENEEYHAQSLSRSNSYMQVRKGNDESISQKLSKSAKLTIDNNRHILAKILEVIILCGKQNIPLRGHTEENSNFLAILETFSKSDALLSDHLANAKYNSKYTSPDVQNELIGICADQVKESILQSCRNSSFFALIVDEATDKSTKEQLSICVRFLENDGAREEFLGFIQCVSIKGKELCAHILQFLQECGLDVLKVRAQCYDGASNMSGKYRGVQALIRERSPHANYVHCKSHCLNLALVHSSNIQCVKTMMSTVQDISFMFDYSAKRLAAFVDELSRDETAKELINRRQRLRTLCETRWSSRADALGTFKNSFTVVVHALETLEVDGDAKAGQYLAAILRFEFIISLIVAEHLLSSTVALTNLLQKEENDLLNAVGETKVVIRLLNNERNDPLVWDALYGKATEVASEFDIVPSRPRRAGRQVHRDNPDVETVSDYWKVTLFNTFLDHLMSEMDMRILSNEDRFVAQHLLPRYLPDLQDETLPSVYAAYAHDLQGSYEDFKNEVRRWRVRWDIAANKPVRLQETLRQTSIDLYPCIHTILAVLLTMPATSASCERSFSAMKRIKNHLRSTMTSERMSALALIHIHKDIDVSIDSAINTFASRKCRQMQFF